MSPAPGNPPPAISVLMVAYNAGAFLAPAVESVLRQTFPALELILVDNASTDGSVAALVESVRDPRLQLHRMTENLGPVGGARAGIAFCRAEWLAMMDADDIAGPGWLDALKRYFAANPDVDLVTTLAEEIDTAGRRIGPAFTLTDETQIHAYAEFDMPVRLNTAMMRRVFAERVGFAPDFSWAGDYEFIGRVLELGRVACLPEVHHCYRVHGGSMTVAGGGRQAMSAAFVRERIARRRRGETIGAESSEEERAMLREPPALRELHRMFAARALAARLPAGVIFHARRMRSPGGVLRGLALALEAEPRRLWFLLRLAGGGPLFAVGAQTPLHNRFGRRRLVAQGSIAPASGLSA